MQELEQVLDAMKDEDYRSRRNAVIHILQTSTPSGNYVTLLAEIVVTQYDMLHTLEKTVAAIELLATAAERSTAAELAR